MSLLFDRGGHRSLSLLARLCNVLGNVDGTTARLLKCVGDGGSCGRFLLLCWHEFNLVYRGCVKPNRLGAFVLPAKSRIRPHVDAVSQLIKFQILHPLLMLVKEQITLLLEYRG